METTIVCALVDRKKKTVLGNTFTIVVGPDAKIEDLTMKIKEGRPYALGNVDVGDLSVWRSIDLKLLETATVTQLEEDLSKVDFADKTKAVKLGCRHVITTLGLSDEILLIEAPSKKDAELSETNTDPHPRESITFFVTLLASEEVDRPQVLTMNEYGTSQVLEDYIRDIVRVPRHPGSAEMRNCLRILINESIEQQLYRTGINAMINDNANTAHPYSDGNHEVFHFIQAISTVYRSGGTEPDPSNEATWLLLFEKFKVHFSSETYKITDALQLTTFLFEFYNYARHVQNGCKVDKEGHAVESMKEAIDQEHLDTLTGKKNGRNDDGNRDPKRRRTGKNQNQDQNHEQIMDALEKANFKVQSVKHDPDLEPMHKLSSHLLEATSSEGVPIVAKLVRSEDSDEVSLLEELNAQRSPHNHVIPLMETLELGLGGFLIILPKKISISNLSPCFLDCEFVRLSHQLVEGVAFLHRHKIAHLDIKPDNLVWDGESRCLYIIDFDIAIRCMEIDEMIELSCGTPNWSAPEIVHGDKRPSHPVNPIRADLRSCGAVLKFFGRGKDRAIDSLTGLLLNHDPRRQPLLHMLVDEEPDFWPSGRLLHALALVGNLKRRCSNSGGSLPKRPQLNAMHASEYASDSDFSPAMQGHFSGSSTQSSATGPASPSSEQFSPGSSPNLKSAPLNNGKAGFVDEGMV
ncbi:hypothetical protein ACEPAG_3660 [Sanghuangporus baumii]